MPGIVGLASTMPRERAERELRRMVATLCHERFYETGTWIDESLGIYVGWCARRGSFSDAMPIRNEGGDVVLVFSGEEFPEPDVARRLKARGHALDLEGPEYLVHWYEEDASFPAGLNGRFHGVLADRARRTVTLFNDRFGMHRLYYHQSTDTFYFAAEAKAILAVRPELRTLSARGLGELLACGCALENRSAFEGIAVVPGASKWMLRDGMVERQDVYFQPSQWESQVPLEPEASYRDIRETFSRILPRYFAGREPVGVSLTGGLDSRMIMAQLETAGGVMPCYTFAGKIRECRDAIVAREVARVCGHPHQVICVGDEFLARFPTYAERTVYLTDGCAEVSRSADLYLNEVARQIAPVRMTGNYGSEVLRQHRAFKPAALPTGLFVPELRAAMEHAEGTYAALLHSHPLSFAAFRQAPWYQYGLLALEQTQLAVRSPFLDNDLVRAVYRAPPVVADGDDLSLRLIADAHPGLRRIRTDRGVGGRGLAAAAVHALREGQFKAEYAYDYGMPQWLAGIDRFLSPLQPERLFLGRHKFCHYRIWYRDELSRYVREVLLDPTTLSLPYFEPKTVEAVVNGHLTGRRNHTVAIHKLLTVELIHRLFVAPPASDLVSEVAGSPTVA